MEIGKESGEGKVATGEEPEGGMKYVWWIGMVIALLMAVFEPNPLWPLLLLAGIGANGLVVALNGWKMPVRGKCEEVVRHTPMTQTTRMKWLGDIIPTGLGTASIGDFLLAAGTLGVFANRVHSYPEMIALWTLGLWVFGWSHGFNLLGKWTLEERKDTRKNIPIVVALMLVGNLLSVRGCSANELIASAKAVKTDIADVRPVEPKKQTKAKYRDLGELTEPPPALLTRLRQETAKTEQSRRKQIAMQATDLAQVLRFTPNVALKTARQGPFCRVTCAAHHGGIYDVETAPELCNANWIPPKAEWVPGWVEISPSQEIQNPWPGPASAGFEHYKLYWSGLQSEAKVVHRSDAAALQVSRITTSKLTVGRSLSH